LNRSTATDQITFIDCGNIRFSAQAVVEVSRGRAFNTILRADIQSLACRHGRLSVQPFLPVAFGLLLCLVGGFFAYVFVLWRIRGGTLSDVVIYLIWLLPLGVWLIFDALQRGYYLEVVANRARLRLALGKRLTPEFLAARLSEVNRVFGYGIGVALALKP